MKPHRLFLIFLLLDMGYHSLWAQNRQSIELTADYGEMILHSRDIRPIGPSSPYALGLEYSFWLYKEANWRNCHCYPRVGISLNYHNFDNPNILGWGIPLYGFLEPWYRIAPRSFFTLRGGAGYAWLSRPYHATDNPLNLSYSMPFTPFITVGAGLAVQISDHWRLGAQIRYNHASNGGQREPNKGLNYPSGNLSLSYSWQPIPFNKRPKVPLDSLEWLREFRLSPFVAGKNIDKSGVSYTIAGAEFSYTQQIARTSALSVGAEYINNMAYRKRIAREGGEEDHQQISFLAGHRFLLGKFSFGQMIGIYLYRPYDIKPDWYQRYSIMWYPWPQIGLGTGLKAHGHVAEFLDFRLSYRLPLRAPRKP